MSGAAGYFAGLPYTAGFYREMAPSHLAFAAIMAGRAPGSALRPRRMLELGFGQGFGLALLAAANPDVAFEGCDLDPENVAQARRFVDDAQLENVAVSQVAFEQAAEDGSDDCDVVAAHGVLSWVAPADQDAIVEVARRRLRPGGLFYVSYNCMPGWSPVVPIRQLAAEVRRRIAGNAERHLAYTLDLLAGLRQAGSAYFAANPVALRHFDGMRMMDRRYLAHEYLDHHWAPLPFSDVASRFQAADVSYVASATLPENLDTLAVPRDVLPILAAIDDPVLKETVRDFAANKQFRRDVFARGQAALAEDERRRTLSELRFTLAVPRHRLVLRFPGPLSEMEGTPQLYTPVLDMLAHGHAGFDELLALPAFGEGRVALLTECLTLLVHSGQVLPVLPPMDVDTAPARRFNRMLVDCAREGRVFDNLASPVTRTGVPVTDFGLLTLMALLDGRGDTPEAAAEHGLGILKRLGRRPHKDGRPIEDDREAVAFLSEHAAPIVLESIPLWRALGMLE